MIRLVIWDLDAIMFYINYHMGRLNQEQTKKHLKALFNFGVVWKEGSVYEEWKGGVGGGRAHRVTQTTQTRKGRRG